MALERMADFQLRRIEVARVLVERAEHLPRVRGVAAPGAELLREGREIVVGQREHRRTVYAGRCDGAAVPRFQRGGAVLRTRGFRSLVARWIGPTWSACSASAGRCRFR